MLFVVCPDSRKKRVRACKHVQKEESDGRKKETGRVRARGELAYERERGREREGERAQGDRREMSGSFRAASPL